VLFRSFYATAARRIHVTWRHESAIDLDDLASELVQHESVLCIVNLKRHAIRLAAALREQRAKGLLHLSTNMCPAHRAVVLDTIRQRLGDGLPVRLIATQCVEAGVDLDFPVVYRALAPLESIAQAAGRCNRHGCHAPGRVVVFKPRDDRGLYPPGYDEAVDSTETFLANLAQQGNLDGIEILNDPMRLRAYFHHFYSLSGRITSGRDDERPLLEAVMGGDFPEVARLYKLIKQDAINVLVPYEPAIFEELRAEITEPERLSLELIRDWIDRASLHAVSLFRPSANASLWNHLEPVQFSRRHPTETWDSQWFFALPGIEYDPLTGMSERLEECWIA
jgi:CRISPR-associated endonuclease/helicase Cas3